MSDGNVSASVRALRGRLLLGFGLGLLVVLVLVMLTDLRKLASTLETFRWELVPLILGLTLFNYVLRFLKWHYYLGLIGVRGIRLSHSVAIFLSGLTMAMTPGKVGELLKSVLLRRVAGTPISVSAPVVMAERLTDGIALIVLSLGGLYLFHVGGAMLGLIALGAALLVFVFVTESGRSLTMALAGMVPFVRERTHHVVALYESSRRLLAPRPLLLAVAIGIISWSGECLAFFLVLAGLGEEASWRLLVTAAFVLGASTLLGSASLMPGGLGVADASVTGLLLLVMPGAVTVPEAVAATLLIRFCTLWFGALVGVVTLLATRRMFEGGAPEVEDSLENSRTISDILS